MALILASASPRRQELLRQMGLDFITLASTVIEDNTQNLPPDALAVLQAKAKALNVAGGIHTNDFVLGADTIVILNGQVYGKPLNAQHAENMLASLSGQVHEVITGIALVDCLKNTLWTDYALTKVKMSAYAAEEIKRYIATGEPFDKAGAYAIQGKGALLVESIQGCYTNVVGLPIPLVYNLLKKAGMNVL